MKTILLNSTLTWNQINLTNSTDKDLFIELYAEELQDVANDGFNKKISFSVDDLHKTLESSDYIFLLQDENNKLYGFVFAQGVKGLFCYLGKLCVRRDAQGHGKAREIIAILKSSIDYKIVTMLTQNSNLIRLIYATHSVTYPITKPYESLNELFPFIFEFLKSEISQLKEFSLATFNGLLLGHYGEMLGKIQLSSKSRLIYNSLQSTLSFKIERGDSILICATV